jgi:dipeptide transport system ATP-binding protein
VALLEIRNLTVEFPTFSGPFKAVDGVDLEVDQGDVLAIVGESGSGKSVLMLALMGLLPWTARVGAERLTFAEADLLRLSAAARRRIIGKDMAMIFQEPMTSLNPCFTVGFQLTEAIKVHEGGSRAERRRRALELLDQVGIPAPRERLGAFPHQLSGGMSQRVMIAMAIACNPRLLIADEPTTALDVTIQAQILDLLLDLQRERDPQHPYTAALLHALPERCQERVLPTIPGLVPGAGDRPSGCLFHPRCGFATPRCSAEEPRFAKGPRGLVRCHYPLTAERPAGHPRHAQ